MVKRWSSGVTEKSSALHLEKGVFAKDNPKEIAKSLKKSADSSRQRKSSSYQSAMSMLNFYINRAGKNLSGERKEILNRAKSELKDIYGK